MVFINELNMLNHIYLYLIIFILTVLESILMPEELYVTYCCYSAIFLISLTLLELSLFGNLKSLYWLSFIMLGTIMAFRNHMGIDDPQYRYHFLRATNMELVQYLSSSNLEKGFLLLQYLLNKLFLSTYFQYQIVITFLSFFFWGVLIDKIREFCEPSVCFCFLWTNWYFLIMYAGLMRIFLAIPIALLSIYYFVNGKYKLYVLFLFLAGSIHSSALFLLLLLIFKYSTKCYAYWQHLCFMTILAMPLLFVLVVKLIVPLLGSRHSSLQLGAFSFSLDSFEFLPLLCLAGYCRKCIEEELILKFYTIGLFLLACTIGLSFAKSIVPELGRLVYYSNFGIVIVAAVLFRQQQKSLNPTVSLVVLSLILFGFFYIVHTAFLNPSAIPHLFPYHSIFNS